MHLFEMPRTYVTLSHERTSMGHFLLRRQWRKQQEKMLLTERSETVGSSPTGTTTTTL